jgi:hypothetical protein
MLKVADFMATQFGTNAGGSTIHGYLAWEWQEPFTAGDGKFSMTEEKRQMRVLALKFSTS